MTLETSEPEPDLIVFQRDAPRAYHPSTAALVIEVSVSSLRRDLGQKPLLYSRAGVAEYWVVDLDGRSIVVHGGPLEDGYGEISMIRGRPAGGDRCRASPRRVPLSRPGRAPRSPPDLGECRLQWR